MDPLIRHDFTSTDRWILVYFAALLWCCFIFIFQIVGLLYNSSRLSATERRSHIATPTSSLRVLIPLFLSYVLSILAVANTVHRLHNATDTLCQYTYWITAALYATAKTANYFFFLQRAKCAQGMKPIFNHRIFDVHLPILLIIVWMGYQLFISLYPFSGHKVVSERTGRQLCIWNEPSRLQHFALTVQAVIDFVWTVFFLYLFGKPMMAIQRRVSRNNLQCQREKDWADRKMNRTIAINFIFSTIISLHSESTSVTAFTVGDGFTWWQPMDNVVMSSCLFVMLASNRRLMAHSLCCSRKCARRILRVPTFHHHDHQSTDLDDRYDPFQRNLSMKREREKDRDRYEKERCASTSPPPTPSFLPDHYQMSPSLRSIAIPNGKTRVESIDSISNFHRKERTETNLTAPPPRDITLCASTSNASMPSIQRMFSRKSTDEMSTMTRSDSIRTITLCDDLCCRSGCGYHSESDTQHVPIHVISVKEWMAYLDGSCWYYKAKLFWTWCYITFCCCHCLLMRFYLRSRSTRSGSNPQRIMQRLFSGEKKLETQKYFGCTAGSASRTSALNILSSMQSMHSVHAVHRSQSGGNSPVTASAHSGGTDRRSGPNTPLPSRDMAGNEDSTVHDESVATATATGHDQESSLHQMTMTVMSVSSGAGSPGHFPSTLLREVDEVEESGDSETSRVSRKSEDDDASRNGMDHETSCSRDLNRYTSTAL